MQIYANCDNYVKNRNAKLVNFDKSYGQDTTTGQMVENLYCERYWSI